MLDGFLNHGKRLVADQSHRLLPETFQTVRYAGVEPGLFHAVFQVMRPENFNGFLDELFILLAGGPHEKGFHAIPDIAPDIVQGDFRKTHRLKREIDGGGDVPGRIHEGAVQIKDQSGNFCHYKSLYHRSHRSASQSEGTTIGLAESWGSAKVPLKMRLQRTESPIAGKRSAG